MTLSDVLIFECEKAKVSYLSKIDEVGWGNTLRSSVLDVGLGGFEVLKQCFVAECQLIHVANGFSTSWQDGGGQVGYGLPREEHREGIVRTLPVPNPVGALVAPAILEPDRKLSRCKVGRLHFHQLNGMQADLLLSNLIPRGSQAAELVHDAVTHLVHVEDVGDRLVEVPALLSKKGRDDGDEVVHGEHVRLLQVLVDDGEQLVDLAVGVANREEVHLHLHEHPHLNKDGKEGQHLLVLVLAAAVVCLKEQHRRELVAGSVLLLAFHLDVAYSPEHDGDGMA